MRPGDYHEFSSDHLPLNYLDEMTLKFMESAPYVRVNFRLLLPQLDDVTERPEHLLAQPQSVPSLSYFFDRDNSIRIVPERDEREENGYPLSYIYYAGCDVIAHVSPAYDSFMYRGVRFANVLIKISHDEKNSKTDSKPETFERAFSHDIFVLAWIQRHQNEKITTPLTDQDLESLMPQAVITLPNEGACQIFGLVREELGQNTSYSAWEFPSPLVEYFLDLEMDRWEEMISDWTWGKATATATKSQPKLN